MNLDDEIELLRSNCRSVFAPTVLDVSAELIDRYQDLIVPVFQEKHFFVSRLDIREVRTALELFDSIAASCGFPDYFGRNWDALKDCLLDFSWVQPKPSGFVLLYRHPELLSWSDMSVFMTIADDVRMIYGQHKKPFKVLMASRSHEQ
jgi:hypothetical protein